MNSFNYFVLLVTVPFQAECKTGEVDQFRRVYDQIKPQASPPPQHISRSAKQTTPMVSFEVFTDKMMDTRRADKPKLPVNVKLENLMKNPELWKDTQGIKMIKNPELWKNTQGVKTVKNPELWKNTQSNKIVKNPELWKNTQSVKMGPKVPETRQVLKNPTQTLATTKKPRYMKYQGLKDAKQLLGKPKELDEETKKAIKARYFKREREDILDVERQKVEELKQKVLRMRKELKNKKKAAKLILLRNGAEGKAKPVLRSNEEYQQMRKSAKLMRKRRKHSSSTTKQMKSRFFVETNTAQITSTTGKSSNVKAKKSSSSSSDEEPVMRGVKRNLGDDDDDDDDELNFDVEGELLSHIVSKR